ncbi:MAG: carbohydrate binding domain-containing protein [Patescibacteria group bacterium]
MRKRTLLGLLGLCLVLVFSAAIVALAEGETAAPPNLLENGDFEAGEVLPWTGYGATTELVTDDVHGGKYAGKGYFDTSWGGGLFQSFRAAKGRYHVVMWVKPGPGAGNNKIWVGVKKFDQMDEKKQVAVTVDEALGWQKVELDFKMTAKMAEIWAWSSALSGQPKGGWVMLDDCVVTPAQ